MKVLLKILLLFVCLSLPLSGFAMKHGDMKTEMGEMDHDSMQMGGAKVLLGEVEVEGVKAQAYLLDVGEAMAKHGMKTTHHLMVEFTDLTKNKPLTKGRAAAKVRLNDGKESKARKMMRMDGAFGTDLTLDQTGDYHFKVGTKLDGKKRVFEFQYEN